MQKNTFECRKSCVSMVLCFINKIKWQSEILSPLHMPMYTSDEISLFAPDRRGNKGNGIIPSLLSSPGSGLLRRNGNEIPLLPQSNSRIIPTALQPTQIKLLIDSAKPSGKLGGGQLSNFNSNPSPSPKSHFTSRQWWNPSNPSSISGRGPK